MATRRLENHDVDLDGHRHLTRRGADLTLAAGGDLALGSGNYFVVSPGTETALRRVSTGNWLAGAVVFVEALTTFAIVSGATAGSGYAPVEVPDGTMSLVAGDVVALGYNGTYWRPLKVGKTSTTTIVVGGISDPTVLATYLFPSIVPDAYLQTPCVGILPYGEGSTITGWVAIDGAYTYEYPTPGPLALMSVGDTVYAQDGDRILVWAPVPFGPGEAKLYWIYEVVDCGSHGYPPTYTKPVIRRASDANTSETVFNGATVRIFGSGVTYDLEYFTVDNTDPVVIGTDDFDISHSSSYSGTDTYPLLTAGQLTSEGPSNDTYDMVLSRTSGEAEGITFESLDGVPGITSFPAGLVTFEHELAWLDADPGGTHKLLWKVYRVDGSTPTLLFTATSQPLHNTTPEPLAFQYQVASAIAFSPTWKLRAVPVLTSDYSGTVTLNLRYNSSARLTRIGLPFQITGSVPGTNQHPLLSGLDDDDQHPWNVLKPEGTARRSVAPLTIGAGGALTLGSGNFFQVNPNSQPLNTISEPNADGTSTTVEVTLLFTGAVVVNHDASPGAGFKSLYLFEAGSVYNPMNFDNPFSIAKFHYSLGAWHLTSYKRT